MEEQPSIPEHPTFRLQQSPSFENLHTSEASRNSLKRNNSDSDMMSAMTMKTWSCSLCMYDNVDPFKPTCGLCGTRREASPPRHHHPQLLTQMSPSAAQSARSKPEPGPGLPSLGSTASLNTNSPKSPMIVTETANNEKMDGVFREQAASAPISQPVLRKVSINSESSDVVAPLPESEKPSPSLSSLKATTDMISMKLLEISEPPADPHCSGLGGLGASEATIQTSNMIQPSASLRASSATIEASNVSNQLSCSSSASSRGSARVSSRGSSARVNQAGIISSNDGAKGIQSGPQEEDVSLDELFAGQKIITREGDAAKAKEASEFSMEKAPASSTRDVVWESPPPPPLPQRVQDDHEPWELPPSYDIETSKPTEIPAFSREKSFKKPLQWKTRFCRIFVVGFVILVVVLSLVLVKDDNNENQDKDATDDEWVLVTDAPIPATAPSPVAPTVPEVPSPTSPVAPTEPDGPSPTATTPPNSATTSSQPTASPTDSLTTEFASITELDGSIEGSRFGTTVALNSEGNLLAALGVSGIDPIQVFEFDNKGTGSWDLHSVVSLSESSSFSTDASVDVASANGVPVLAVASTLSFRVLEYVNGDWRPRGQESLEWVSADDNTKPSVSASAISISIDGTVLAAGSLNDSGEAIVVQVFTFNEASQLWESLGDPIVRSRLDGAASFNSMSLALSGDGSVVALGDWLFSSPAASVETFEWKNNDGWTRRGDALTFNWGPATVALSENGGRLAITTPSPGTARIYDWDGNDEWVKVGKDIAGGSTIALTRGGMRVMIGDPLSSQVWVHDYLDEVWVANLPLDGDSASQFGASIAMSNNGNILAVGVPLDDTAGNNAGRAFIYR